MTDLKSELKKHFGFDHFRADQENIVQHVLDKKSALVLMPTGQGKSLCYQLPAKLMNGLVLVISPLIALMQDQVAHGQKMGIRCDFINSSLNTDERKKRYKRLAENQYELLYVTPERFRKVEFLEAIAKVQVTLLAVDEAHCISQWGHDFRPDYSRMGDIRARLGNPPVLALTATATPEVQKDIIKQLQMPEATTFFSGIERDNLKIKVHDIYGIEEKIIKILELRKQILGPAIVYFSLIQTLQKVSQALSKNGVSHLLYHGDLSSQERRQKQNAFMKSDQELILATPAFGLGVNKENVRLLIHGEVPNSIESYYQEIGRAGRDGLDSECHLLFDEEDVTIQMEFIKWANPDANFVAAIYQLIKKNPERVSQEGFDFLRQQMNFHNKRDYRSETAVNLLERMGCLATNDTRFGFEAVQEPTPEMLDQKQIDLRIKSQNQKLLAILQFAKQQDLCRMQIIYRYFGIQNLEDCGHCDCC